ncbi:hypothetical protein ACFFJQ_06505 [Bacillus capparidis]|uniref:Disulfide oxidoreductase YuzD n=1 Tax=Bacillus capparidis TaxID=1840411 RepID=A0ABS4CUF4_9BACI|nr:hypothetical protein [Bacillus capparidis]MBP1080970.1 disulfide oxidoreductase YuzD [Bacillus capparidis]MED1095670.1 hypothetical protein [Bacillus capparidis]
MNELIIENSDLLHEVIYVIDDDAQEIKYPIQRVVDFLLSEGYLISKSESKRTSFVLYKNKVKTTITENFISFQKLEQVYRERYKQNFYKYLISRSKIYYQSALQNAKASKINLIQNQRRTCVSNMYYSLHNSFASMVEFYKTEKVIDKSILELDNTNEDETKLEHFTPIALEAFKNNIDEILISGKEDFISRQEMNAGRMKSFENPFTWIFPLFSELFKEEKFTEMVETMVESLNKVNIENLGIDTSSRCSSFEIQLKLILKEIRESSKEDRISNPQKYSCLNMAAFFAYGYMLRQSADYDSLFEVKIPHQDIINWTIITSNFLNFVSGFLSENYNEFSGRVQKLDAESSTEILKSLDNDSLNTVMTMTGIIIDKDFNLIDIIKNLYSQKGYNMINQRGMITELSENTDNITICRLLFSTPLECFISISSQGLFRVDIVLSDTTIDTKFSKGINQFYLEKLIHEEIIQKDLLSVVSKNAKIVRGIPSTPQYNSLGYLDLVLGIHEGIKFKFVSKINKYLRDFTEKISNEKFVINSDFSINSLEKLKFISRQNSILFVPRSPRRREVINQIENGLTDKLLFIFFYTDSEISSNIKESLETKICKEYPKLDFKVEFVQITDVETRQLIEEDYSYFEVKIKNLMEKFGNSQNSDEFKQQIEELIESETEDELEIEGLEATVK